MNIITDYNELEVNGLQSARLYVQGRPLVSLWSRKRRGIPQNHSHVDIIESELGNCYVAVDCGGWYFANNQRTCTAIEILPHSKKLWSQVHFEYDYMTWHPTYLSEPTVLAYYSTYFKYSTLEDFLKFCKTWTPHHKKIIIALDSSKIKFNYLKYNLIDIIADQLPNIRIRILDKNNFDLLFTLENT